MNGRNRFAVGVLTLLFVISWVQSLGPLFGIHFWDPKHVLSIFQEQSNNPMFYNETAMTRIVTTYYKPRRYVYMLPHILGAIVWWNLYFLQLVPSIRHAKNKQIHRMLGRVLFVAAFLQTMSGVGLAATSHSLVIKILSFVLAAAVLFCMYHAYFYARYRDIPKHKYWVLKMVGYLQSIALQRFWMLVLIISHRMGWHGLYPDLDHATVEEANAVVLQIFDHSFILAILTAFLGTDWYLSGEMGMMDPPEGNVLPGNCEDAQEATTNSGAVATVPESEPLLQEAPLINS